MPDIPSTEPSALRAGDTWKWTRTLADYPAPTWTLKYRFKHPTAAGFEIVASASGTDHSITLAAADSGKTAGTYSWIAWVEGGSSEKYTVGEGVVEITADYRSGAATTVLDDRTHAAKVLAAIEAWIEGRDMAVAEYEIAGRRMKYIPIADLVKLRNRYRQEVATEEAQRKLAAGLGTGRRIQVRI